MVTNGFSAPSSSVASKGRQQQQRQKEIRNNATRKRTTVGPRPRVSDRSLQANSQREPLSAAERSRLVSWEENTEVKRST